MSLPLYTALLLTSLLMAALLLLIFFETELRKRNKPGFQKTFRVLVVSAIFGILLTGFMGITSASASLAQQYHKAAVINK